MTSRFDADRRVVQHPNVRVLDQGDLGAHRYAAEVQRVIDIARAAGRKQGLQDAIDLLRKMNMHADPGVDRAIALLLEYQAGGGPR